MLVALVQNNLVVGVGDFDETTLQVIGNQFQEIIEITNLIPMPGIGWGFDGQNIIGTTVSQKITKLAMNQRFSIGEMLGLLTYVGANPSSIVAVLLNRLSLATFIDLSRPDTQAGIGVLVSYGLLTSARATIILTTVPNPTEIYQG